MPETFLASLEDGPYPGQYEFPEDEEVVFWPLPQEIFAKGHKEGTYQKFWESSGAPKTTDEARGAKYRWAENMPTTEFTLSS